MSRGQSIHVVVWIVAGLALIQLSFAGNGREGGGPSPGSTSAPATTTATATSTAGVVTPVPLGQWVGWPSRPTDTLSLEDVELRDVYFPSADEGWAVGFGKRRLAGWDDVAIILHYQDNEWRVDESLALEDRRDVRLLAIDGTGPDNIWAVGKDYDPLIFRDGDIAAFLHYDGDQWHKLDVSRLGRAAWAVLTDIAMVLDSEGNPEGWAISLPGDDGRGSYVLHFTDGEWQLQREINRKKLWTIDMVSATDGWIVAEDTNCNNESGCRNLFFWYHRGRWEDKASWGPPMYGVSMADALYGWAVGPSGFVDEYIGECHDPRPNRPCHWLQDTITGPDGRTMGIDFWDIQLMSRYDGWLVGNHHDVASSVVHYVRRSQDVTSRRYDWNMVDIVNDPVKDMFGLYMLPGPDGWAVDGWAVGEDGAILHYEGPQQPPTATPTATPTPTGTASVTPSLTASPSMTLSATPPPSPTSTPSATPQPPEQHIFLPFVAHNGTSPSGLTNEFAATLANPAFVGWVSSRRKATSQ